MAVDKKLLIFAVLAIIATSCNAFKLPMASKSRREVIVDQNGFYLGGGSNNNLREGSQLYDLGGPIVNPWINAFTQPIERTGTAQRLGTFGLGGFGAGFGGVGIGAGIGGIGAGIGGIGGLPVGGIGGLPVGGGVATGGVADGSNLLSGLNSQTLQQLAQMISQLAQQQTQNGGQSQIDQQQIQQQQIQQQQIQQQPQQQKLSPFTAIFLNNGQPPLFKVGIPSDYPNGYTTV